MMGTSSDDAIERTSANIAKWAKDLIDLSQRNLALYHRPSRRASLNLHAPDALTLHRRLTGGDSFAFFIPPAEAGSSPTNGRTVARTTWTVEQSLEMARQNELVTDRTDGPDLVKTLTNLLRTTNQDWLDRAVRTLYVAFGQLVWTEDLDGRDVVRSPLVYLPVTLRRGGAKDPFLLEPTEDDAVLNPSLVVKLKDSFALDLTVATEAVNNSLTLDEIFEAVEEAVDPVGWSVEHAAALKRSTFHKESMYRDLLANQDRISAHPLVQSLAGVSSARTHDPLDGIPGVETLDDAVEPETTHLVLDADSSQRRAVLAAVNGVSFVMDGPPGTGKSQTIVNMIAELIAQGRSVLFVSEKAAALEVVAKRLAAVGLQDFVLELHSHRASRREVVTQLAEAIRRRPEPSGGLSEADRDRLRAARKELNEYATAVNEIRSPLGRNVNWVVGRLAELDAAPRLQVPAGDPTALSAAALDGIVEDARALSLTWDRVNAPTFRWRDLDPVTRATQERAETLVEGARRAIAEFRDLLRPFADELGLSMPGGLDEARSVLTLVALAADRPEVAPLEWLTSDDVASTATIAQLRSAIDAVRDAGDALSDAYPAGWEQIAVPTAEDLREAVAGAQANLDVDLPLGLPVIADVRSVVRGLQEVVTEVQTEADRVAHLCGTRTDGLTVDQVARMAAVAERAAAVHRPDPEWLTYRTAIAVEKAIGELVRLRRSERAAQTSVQGLLRPESAAIDLPAAVNRYRSTRRRLTAFGTSGRAARAALRQALTMKPSLVDDAHLDQAVAAWRAARALREAEDRHGPLLQRFRRGDRFDLKAAREALELAIEVRQAAGDGFDPSLGARQFCGARPADPDIIVQGQRLQAALALLEELRLRMGPFAWTRSGVRRWSAAVHDMTAAVAAAAQLVDLIGPVLAARSGPASLQQLLREVELIAAARTAAADLQQLDRIIAPLLGRPAGSAPVRPDDVILLEAGLAWADRVRTTFPGAFPAMVAERLREMDVTRATVALLEQSLTALRAALGSVTALFATDAAAALATELEQDLEAATETLEQLETSLDQIDDWWDHHEALAGVERAGLGPQLAEAAAKRLVGAELPAALERTILSAWVERILEADQRLARIGVGRRDGRVMEFQRLDRALHTDAAQRVITACTARRPRGTVGGTQIIMREANKKARHKPVRQLLTEAGQIVIDLKPCLMMSPMSVSQYLPPDWTFDVVIFDEASQIPPQDAINSIYRGSQLVIAGDEKQLPPTSFFELASGDEDEDAEDFVLDEFESVLKIAKSSTAFADLGLRWHYRSRHEDLITFSNHRFYDSELITYPGAESAGPTLGVQHILVEDGVYRRSGRRDNPVEAEVVARRVAHHLRSHPSLSIGVVALSRAQAEAIEDAVDRLRREERDLDEAFRSDRLEGFFVKNLENVQGDDRDIIILSIGYGPDEVGRFTMNFGPMNPAGGWRRLNVAVTRARMRMEVVSSFTSDRIRPTSPDSSIAVLKAYLEYAERGPISLFDVPTGSLGDVESPLEAEVLRTIRSWGYAAVPQVGTASYRIDIGITDPANPDRYVLGVECDGAMYHSSRVARDRDRLRQQVLEGLGWRLHRIWGPTWYRNRRKAEDELRAAIESALRGEANEGDDAAAPELIVRHVDIDPAAPPDWAQPYERHPLPRLVGRDPADPRSGDALQKLLRGIVAAEHPIHLSRLKALVEQAFGAPRSLATSNAIVSTLRLLAVADAARLDADEFVRRPGADVRVRYPVDDADRRSAVELPPEEIALAVLNIVRDAREATIEDLRRAVRDLFRLDRVGKRLNDAVDEALRGHVRAGTLTRDGDRVRAA